MVVGLLASYIVTKLGWRVMMVINASTILVIGTLSGLVLKPLPPQPVQETNVERKDNAEVFLLLAKGFELKIYFSSSRIQATNLILF